MKFIETKLKDAWLLEPNVFQDERGFFMETYCDKWFDEKGIDIKFVQDNHSKSCERGVLRGLHFQRPPMTQAKLVRVTAGSVYDVIVDLRKKSPTYGQWEGFELTADNFLMLFVPRGFAHGYCTLEKNTEFMYKVDNYYAPDYDDGIIWNALTLKIDWPVKDPVLSKKDSQLRQFDGFETPFD